MLGPAAGSRRYERQRTPAPLVPTRIPSGRRAVEQPNASDDGEARLSARFWACLLVTGVATGLLGALLIGVLHAVQRIAYGPGTLPQAVARASSARVLLVLAAGGLVTGLGWAALRRWGHGTSDVDDAVWTGTGELAFGRSLASGTLSEVAVGVGASLGQEAAPKLMGAASGSALARWAALDGPQRRLLVACGAGAGMAAVYNVALGGALLAAELLLASFALSAVLPALVCSVVATATGWLFFGTGATYDRLPQVSTTPALMAFAVVVGPLLGVLAVVVVRGVGWVSHHQLRGRLAAVGPAFAFPVVGVVALAVPDVLGNGRTIAERALYTGGGSLLLLLALVLLKPALTLLCLWSGASGGLFTPVLCTGAALGALLGRGWGSMWPGTPVAAFALVAAAALSGAAMQAPVTATVLVLELTGHSEPVLVPVLLATAVATTVARYLDGYSVFSARLPSKEQV